jgi:formamidopyrimidine-DNA glycosylase
MPELPEVETVARSLRPHLVGRRVLGVETSGLPLRRAVDAEALRAATKGARFDAVERRAKYLLLGLSRGHVVVAHLGMTGRFIVAPQATPRPQHTHVVFRLDGEEELRYVDARRFGVLGVVPRARLDESPELAAVGVDPLTEAFTAAWLTAELAGSRRDVKQFLLDQGRVAGLGNIYVSEALHVAGISPRRRADQVGPLRAGRLHAAIRNVLVAAVERRGTTLRDYVDADGELGDNQNHLAVYGREGEPCRRCGGRVKRLVQGARSTFYCPGCQR